MRLFRSIRINLGFWLILGFLTLLAGACSSGSSAPGDDGDNIVKQGDADADSAADTHGSRPDTATSDTGFEIDTNPAVTCLSAPCDPNAICDDSTAQLTCTCVAGWRGDGFSCTDVDECQEGIDNCDSNFGTCANNVGSFSCGCQIGYHLEGVACVVDSACTDGDTRTGSTVCGINSNGFYEQRCAGGVWGDTTTCIDTDVCTNGDSGPSISPCGINNAGSILQRCVDGVWEMTTTCIDDDVCANGTTQTGTTACQGTGTLEQLCQDGQWQDGTVCVGGSVDECNTTAECLAIYGSAATDCVNSAAPDSYCQCGDVACINMDTEPVDTATVDTATVDTTPQDTGTTLGISGFTLINATTDQDIRTLVDGDVISLADDGTALNIRADTVGAVTSVVFALNANTNYNTEGTAPFAMAGDNAGDYKVWTPAVGTYTLTATGSAGTPLTITFTVVADGGRPQVNAGADQVLVMPSNSVVLAGSATDSDGTIASVLWTKVSGPAATMSGAGTTTLSLSNLVEGTYVFRLTATDNEGNTGVDDVTVTVVPDTAGAGIITGELRMWHKVTVTWDGPSASESGTPNPFMDYRLNCTFTSPSGTSFLVPGYFAADGDAANSSATSGNKWRCHLCPDEQGTWTYKVSFRSGTDIAVSDDVNAGSSAGYMDGDVGQFDVLPTNKTGRDMRAKGLLEYVGGHFLRFAGNGEYFLKQGTDAPENFLAYEDFDGDFKTDGIKDNLIKSWAPHAGDWKTGDPSWQGNKGTELIGAINYLASKGLNSFSFLTMNINGDDKNVFPYTTYNERYRMDVSKLAQWEIIFAHGTHMGFFLHFKTQEAENTRLLDDGDMGPQRALYYRELIARFAHHPALNWNLGEEVGLGNTITSTQKRDWAEYFWTHDPYHHHIVIHNGDNHYELMGPAPSGSYLTGFSLQTNKTDFSNVHSRVLDYLNRSDAAGKPWAVACDEPGDAQHALRPAGDEGSSWEDGRKNGIWGTFMAGGWGNEWYFGYAHDNSDLTCQDFRSRDGFWDYSRYAMAFFVNNDVPVQEMTNDDSLSSAANDYCYYKANEVYVVYLKNGGTTNLNLNGASGTFEVKWYDPRNGGALQNGSVTSVSGGGSRSLGSAPNNTGKDWVILVRKS